MPGEGQPELSQVLIDRRRKLAELRAAGVEPFPHAFPGVQPIADVKAPHADLADGAETDVRARIAGRLAARRGQGKAFEYAIVGSTEADPMSGRLSNESPVGKALIGRKKGDTVTVPAPKGERKLTISKIGVA